MGLSRMRLVWLIQAWAPAPCGAAVWVPRPLSTTDRHKSKASVLQLGSEVKLRFKVVGFVLRKKQPGPGFQPSFATSLLGV